MVTNILHGCWCAKLLKQHLLILHQQKITLNGDDYEMIIRTELVE